MASDFACIAFVLSVFSTLIIQGSYAQLVSGTPIACSVERRGLHRGLTSLLSSPRVLAALRLRGGDAGDKGEESNGKGANSPYMAVARAVCDRADAIADCMNDEIADEMANEMQDEEGSENPVRDLIEQGCAAWDENADATLAEAKFREALALDPSNPDALCSMAVHSLALSLSLSLSLTHTHT